MARPKFEYAGHGIDEDGKARPVISGDTVFRLLDAHGIPLAVQQIGMEKNGMAFDVLGFCKAAQQSGHYSRDKTRRVLVEGYSEVHDAERIGLIDKCLNLAFAG